jgi:hypothetical protein
MPACDYRDNDSDNSGGAADRYEGFAEYIRNRVELPLIEDYSYFNNAGLPKEYGSGNNRGN